MGRLVVLLFVIVCEVCCVSASCPNNWTRHLDSCYLFVMRNPLAWNSAWNFCKNYGGILAEIDSASENNFLKTQAKQIGGTFWLGGTDIIVEGEWEWMSSHRQVSFTDWAPGQPTNAKGAEHCLELNMVFAKAWNDGPCGVKHNFICEKQVNVVGSVAGNLIG